MTAFSTDLDALELVRSKLPDRAAALAAARTYADGDAALARKALWVYEQILPPAVTPRTGVSRVHFQSEWLTASADFICCAAQATAGYRLAYPWSNETRVLSISWHVPEWPLLLPGLRDSGALALIAQEAPWIRMAAGPDATLMFRAPGAVLAIVRSFRAGRPIAAMLDYCYDDTTAISSSFLGRATRTPSGLFVLARRFGYSLQVVSIVDGRAQVVESVTAADVSRLAIDELADIVNAALGAEILRDPPRWLLWPALDRRWITPVPIGAGSHSESSGEQPQNDL